MASMTIYLCNEVIASRPFREQCIFARECGYDGIEIAPFTLGEDPTRLTAAQIADYRAIAEGEGVGVGGLHWLFAAPQGLSITSRDDTVFGETCDAGRRLIDLCAGLGGAYLVHGSPKQRQLAPGNEAEGRERARIFFAAMAGSAGDAGLAYIIEPLARADTGLINSVDEALALIDDVGLQSLKTMVDCYATASNGEDVAALLARWLPRGAISHVHFNDSNRRGPGQGSIDFAAILSTLRAHKYIGTTAAEPFDYVPDGFSAAARAIGFLRGMEQAIDQASILAPGVKAGASAS